MRKFMVLVIHKQTAPGSYHSSDEFDLFSAVASIREMETYRYMRFIREQSEDVNFYRFESFNVYYHEK